MRRIFRVALWGIIILVAAGIILARAVYLITRDMCANRIVAEINSPDGSHRAVEFERDCGAPTDFSTQVSVIESAKKLGSDVGGNAFIADSNHGVVPVHTPGVMVMDMKWLNNNTLLIEYPAGARLFNRKNRVQGVAIQYTAR